MHRWSKYPIIALDTEYDEKKRPFLATSVDEQLRVQLYRLEVPSDYRAFKHLCERPNIVKVFHQAVADIFALSNIGITVSPPYDDTMIMASLMNEQFSRLGLKELARTFLHDETETQTKLKTVINRMKRKKGRAFSWRDVPRDVLEPYAKDDPYHTIRLFYLWRDHIKPYRKVYEFERALIDVVVRMQKNGIRIDRTFVNAQIYAYSKSLLKVEKDIQRFARRYGLGRINPRANNDIVKVLQRMNAPLYKETKTGWSVDAEVMQTLAVKSEIEQRHRVLKVPNVVRDFAKVMMEYRFLSKHLSTYYLPLYEYYTSPNNDIAHFDFYQSGAKTGRFSAELFQTFPRPEVSQRTGKQHEVRKCVIPPDGCVIVAIDKDQVEMRLFAHYSQSARMIKAFETGKDPYVQIAEDLFSKALMEESKELFKALRWIGKKIALGIIYGMSAMKLMKTLSLELPNMADEQTVKKVDMSYERSQEILQKFYTLYPVQQYMRRLTQEVYRRGTLTLRIRSPLMDVYRVYHIAQQFAYKAVNVQIQGTAAYVMKHAMMRCDELIRTDELMRKLNVRMIATVHDELIFYVDNKNGVSTCVKNLIDAMEDYQTFFVPITVSAKVSARSWGEVVEWDQKTSIKRMCA